MQFVESNEQAGRIAIAAIEHMHGLGIAPNPKNYSVWYAYCAGIIPDLRRELDRLIQAQKPFTPEINERLYERYLGISDQAKGLEAVAEKLGTALSSVLTNVDDAHRGAAQYGSSLKDFSGKISVLGNGDAEAWHAAVETLVSRTEQMQKLNQRLETQLQQSSVEIAQLRQNVTVLRAEATVDGLTGLANRRSFDSALRNSIETAREMGQPLTLVMLDIDHFKRFNDTYGHVLGDQVLKLAARTIQDGIGEEDIAARYGGEEFAVILVNRGLDEAMAIGDRLREAVASKKVVNRRNNQLLGQITLSVGVAQLSAEDAAVSLLERADLALYAAKRSGRNRVLSERHLDREAEPA